MSFVTDPQTLQRQPASGPQQLVAVVFALLYLRLFVGSLPPGMLGALTGLVTLGQLALILVFVFQSPRMERRHTPLMFPLLAMLAVALISAFATHPPDMEAAQEFFLRLILFASWIFFASRALTGPRAVRMLAKWCRVAIYLGAGLAVVQYVVFPGIYQIRGAPRAFGMMGHPVTFGMFIFLALMFHEFARIKFGRRRHGQDYLIIAAAFVGMGFAIAQTAWMMLVVVLFLIFVGRFNLVKQVVFLPLFLMITLGVLYAIPFTRDVFSLGTIFLRFGEIAVDHYSHELVTDSMSWRVVNWKMSVGAMLPQWYVGMGPGQAEHYNYFNLTLHSLPLEVLVEIGFFGLAFLLLFLARLGRLMKASVHDSPEDARARSFARNVSIATLFASLFSVTLMEQSLYLQLLLAMILIADKPFPQNLRAREEAFSREEGSRYAH